MPRDGSIKLPEGVVPAEPMDVGEVANPPFAVLPDPTTLYRRRAARFATLAPGHELGGYLAFLGRVAAAQDEVQKDLAVPRLPPPARLLTAYEHEMPPLSPAQVDLDEVADRTLLGIVERLLAGEMTAESRKAAEAVRDASADERRDMMLSVLMDAVPEDAIGEHVLAAAGVQVHMSRLAARLDAGRLSNVADSACPACGGGVVSSTIVGREGSHGTRYCTCSVCSTEWNVSRIKCLVCGSEKGIAYQSIAGGSGVVMGETCDGCKSYVKMLHQHKDASLEAFADDVATLALDLVLGADGWQRASANPFLLGY